MGAFGVIQASLGAVKHHPHRLPGPGHPQAGSQWGGCGPHWPQAKGPDHPCAGYHRVPVCLPPSQPPSRLSNYHSHPESFNPKQKHTRSKLPGSHEGNACPGSWSRAVSHGRWDPRASNYSCQPSKRWCHEGASTPPANCHSYCHGKILKYVKIQILEFQFMNTRMQSYIFQQKDVLHPLITKLRWIRVRKYCHGVFAKFSCI